MTLIVKMRLCKSCGKNFWYIPNRYNNGRKYCNTACQVAYYRSDK